MPVNMQRMHIMRRRNEAADYNRVAQVALQQRRPRIAMYLTAKEASWIAPSCFEWLDAHVDGAATRIIHLRQAAVVLQEQDQLAETAHDVERDNSICMHIDNRPTLHFLPRMRIMVGR